MRFPTIFRRRVGDPKDSPFEPSWFEAAPGFPGRILPIPELGSDVLPKDKEFARRDNLHESRLVNVNGFPSQRIVVGYQGPPQAPALLAEMYLYDETSSSWFLVPPCNGDGILLPGKLSYFDPPCLLDHSRAKKNSEDESHQSGSLEVLIIVKAETPGRFDLADERRKLEEDPGAGHYLFPPGVYTFVIGTDVSNPG